MDLKEIQKKLEKTGYKLFLNTKKKILFCSIESAPGEKIDGSMSQTSIKEGKYICLHFNRNIPVEHQFSTAEEVVSYITRQFPIKNK